MTYDQKDIGDLDHWLFSLTPAVDHPTASMCVTPPCKTTHINDL